MPMSSRNSSGSAPAVGQLRPRAGRLVVLDERDTRVAQRIDARGDRQLRVAAQGGEALAVDAELLHQVERAGAGSELDDLVEPVDRLERGARRPRP